MTSQEVAISGEQYLKRTESAVQHLFRGIGTYLRPLKQHPPVVGLTFESNATDRQTEFSEWIDKNHALIQKSREANAKFAAEHFALATLCGAVLQVAAKGIGIYSARRSVPKELTDLVGSGPSVARYCVGRTVKDLPLGLIILAGRNQHMHHEETTLQHINVAILKRVSRVRLADNSDSSDPAFVHGSPGLVSLAANITALMDWRSYDRYILDMRSMIGLELPPDCEAVGSHDGT